MGRDKAEWIHLAQGMVQCEAVVTTVMNVRVVYKARNILTSLINVRFKRSSLFHELESSVIGIFNWWPADVLCGSRSFL